jgi:hypothetical protein
MKMPPLWGEEEKIIIPLIDYNNLTFNPIIQK